MGSFYLCNTAALELNLSKSAFKVYSFLAMSAGRESRESYYKKANIAARCRISESTVIRAIRELCQKGLLEIQRRFWGKGQQTSNLYRLLDNPQLKMCDAKPQESTVSPSSLHNAPSPKASQKRIRAKVRLFKCGAAALHANVSPTALKVYSYLSLRADQEGKCFPSMKEIAADCGISVSTVYRAVKKLAHEGLLDVIHQTRAMIFGNNGTSENLYVVKGQESEPEGTMSNICNDKATTEDCSTDIDSTSSVFLSKMTPSPLSPVTPHRTISRKKVTLKQRKKDLFSKLAKRYMLHIHSRSIKGFLRTSRDLSHSDSG